MTSLLRKKIARHSLYGGLSAALFMLSGVFTVAFADQSIGDLADNIRESLSGVETMIIAMCYIGGVAFGGAAIMKFKQYKDNPQQITLGQPIALVFIAAALVWLPQLIKTSGQTVFGQTEGAGNEAVSGSGQTGIFD